MKKNHIIYVTGQLGGTLFRQEARQEAERLGLTGIVRIQSNGELRIETEGEEEDLETFIKWCKICPDGTTVQSVRVQDEPLQGYEKFLEMH